MSGLWRTALSTCTGLLITLVSAGLWGADSAADPEPHPAQLRTAIFAGGCFWCMEADFEKWQHSGIIRVVSGFDGGTRKNPDYHEVASGNTAYKEAVRVTYNPRQVSYKELLIFFFTHIDPTVKNRQFCDHGKQYASAVFYLNRQQQQAAEQMRDKVQHVLDTTIHTRILPSTEFYKAAAPHQNYYRNHQLKYQYYRWRCGRDDRLAEIWSGHRNQLRHQ